MTAERLIKGVILRRIFASEYFEGEVKEVDPSHIDELWQEIDEGVDSDFLAELLFDFRHEYDCEDGDTPCGCSRHYESKSVAKKIGEQWVGWTYWYGGGKHSDPDEIEWLSEAYLLSCKEEQVTVTKRTFEVVK